MCGPQNFQKWLVDVTPEKAVPQCWSAENLSTCVCLWYGIYSMYSMCAYVCMYVYDTTYVYYREHVRIVCVFVFPAGATGTALYEVLVIQTFRPDRLTAMLAMFVSSIMGDSFLAQCDQELNLAHIVENEVSAKTPVLLASVVGYDASSRIDDLTVQLNKQCTPVAMGQLTSQ